MPLADVLGVVVGAVSLLGFGLYQLYAPTYLGVDTALAPIINDVPQKVDEQGEAIDSVKTKVEDIEENVDDVQSQQKVQMQVQRAQARANDQMDHERVDQYLLENGVEPNEFLRGDQMQGFDNWHDTNDNKSEVNEDE